MSTSQGPARQTEHQYDGPKYGGYVTCSLCGAVEPKARSRCAGNDAYDAMREALERAAIFMELLAEADRNKWEGLTSLAHGAEWHLNCILAALEGRGLDETYEESLANGKDGHK